MIQTEHIVQAFRQFADWHNGINTFIYGLSDRQLGAELSKTHYRLLHLDFPEATSINRSKDGFDVQYNLSLAILDNTRPDDFQREHDILAEIEIIALDLIGYLLQGYTDLATFKKKQPLGSNISIRQFYPVYRFKGNDNTWGWTIELSVKSYICYNFEQRLTIKPTSGIASFRWESDGSNITLMNTSTFGSSCKWLYRLNCDNQLQESATPPALTLDPNGDNWIVILECTDVNGCHKWARATIETNSKPYKGVSYPFIMLQQDDTLAQLNPDSNI